MLAVWVGPAIVAAVISGLVWRKLAAEAERALDNASDSIDRTRASLTLNRLDGR
jgi:hypothetical protein